MYILDTNTVIHYFKGVASVVHRLLSVSPSSIAIPSVVIYELEVGILKSATKQKRRKQLDALTKTVQTIPFTDVEAREAAHVRTYLESIGTPIGSIDNQIAGVVLSQNAILVTRNTKEFTRVPNLRIENWYQT